MAVPTRITDLSATASSNSPAGSDTVGTTWDDYLRAAFQIIRGDLATKGSDIASASTTDLGAVQGLFHDITGTTSITSLGTVAAGIWKVIKFEGALTLTYNATSLILPGAANITTADGDVAIVTSEGSGNWRCVKYQRANGRPVIGTVLDSIFRIQDDGDATKQIAFQASGITAGNTRTITAPDADVTLLTGAATQAEQETGSITTASVTPGRQQYHASAAKAWVKFAGASGTVSASYNVTSVTRTGTGAYTISFTTAFSSANYCAVGTQQGNTRGVVAVNTPAAGSCTVTTSDGNTGAGEDETNVYVAFFGDQ